MNLTSGQTLLFKYNQAFDQSNIQLNLTSCQIARLEGRSVQNADQTVLQTVQIADWVQMPNAN